MEDAYKNVMLDALPTPTTAEIHLHTADPGVGDGDANVIAGVTISAVVFGAAAAGSRVLTYDAQVPSDATTVAFMTVWVGGARVTKADPPDKTLDSADTLHGTHTYSL